MLNLILKGSHYNSSWKREGEWVPHVATHWSPQQVLHNLTVNQRQSRGNIGISSNLVADKRSGSMLETGSGIRFGLLVVSAGDFDFRVCRNSQRRVLRCFKGFCLLVSTVTVCMFIRMNIMNWLQSQNPILEFPKLKWFVLGGGPWFKTHSFLWTAGAYDISITWVSFSHPSLTSMCALRDNARLFGFFKQERAWAWEFISVVLLVWGVRICLASICRYLVACDVASLLANLSAWRERTMNVVPPCIDMKCSGNWTWRVFNVYRIHRIPTRSGTSFMDVSWAFCPQHEPVEGQRWTPGKRTLGQKNQGHRAASWEYWIFGANLVSCWHREIGVALSCSKFLMLFVSFVAQASLVAQGTLHLSQDSLCMSRLHPLEVKKEEKVKKSSAGCGKRTFTLLHIAHLRCS